MRFSGRLDLESEQAHQLRSMISSNVNIDVPILIVSILTFVKVVLKQLIQML